MRCPSCEAMVPVGAEFCPQCKAPTNPRLRERLAGQQLEEDPKRRRRTYFLIGAAFVFGLVIGGQSSWFGPDFDFDSPVPRSRPAVAEARQLFDAYRDDEHEADERFGNRPLVVTGEFLQIVHDGRGHPDLRLKTSDGENPLGADIIGESFDASAELRPGQTVTLSCERITGGGDDRWLQGCAIEQAAQAEGEPVNSAEPEA